MKGRWQEAAATFSFLLLLATKLDGLHHVELQNNFEASSARRTKNRPADPSLADAQIDALKDPQFVDNFPLSLLSPQKDFKRGKGEGNFPQAFTAAARGGILPPRRVEGEGQQRR